MTEKTTQIQKNHPKGRTLTLTLRWMGDQQSKKKARRQDGTQKIGRQSNKNQQKLANLPKKRRGQETPHQKDRASGHTLPRQVSFFYI